MGIRIFRRRIKSFYRRSKSTKIGQLLFRYHRLLGISGAIMLVLSNTLIVNQRSQFQHFRLAEQLYSRQDYYAAERECSLSLSAYDSMGILNRSEMQELAADTLYLRSLVQIAAADPQHQKRAAAATDLKAALRLNPGDLAFGIKPIENMKQSDLRRWHEKSIVFKRSLEILSQSSAQAHLEQVSIGKD